MIVELQDACQNALLLRKKLFPRSGDTPQNRMAEGFLPFFEGALFFYLEWLIFCQRSVLPGEKRYKAVGKEKKLHFGRKIHDLFCLETGKTGAEFCSF